MRESLLKPVIMYAGTALLLILMSFLSELLFVK